MRRARADAVVHAALRDDAALRALRDALHAAWPWPRPALVKAHHSPKDALYALQHDAPLADRLRACAAYLRCASADECVVRLAKSLRVAEDLALRSCQALFVVRWHADVDPCRELRVFYGDGGVLLGASGVPDCPPLGGESTGEPLRRAVRDACAPLARRLGRCAIDVSVAAGAPAVRVLEVNPLDGDTDLYLFSPNDLSRVAAHRADVTLRLPWGDSGTTASAPQ